SSDLPSSSCSISARASSRRQPEPRGYNPPMSESCLRRAAVALASAAILAVASTIPPSFAQSSRDADAPRLYRIEVLAFSYREGDPTEELFAHTAARASIDSVDREAATETFDFSRYLPPSFDEPFDDIGADGPDTEARRPRRLLGTDNEPGGADERPAEGAAAPDPGASAGRNALDGAMPGPVATDDPGNAERGDTLGAA